MTDILDDYHAWQAYPHYRWIFNKLEVSLRLGYHAGPAGIPVQRTGYYIVRPCVNALGLGLGAKKVWLEKNTMHLPYGYFWCEWFEGRHFSVDYKWGNQMFCVEGFKSDDTFTRWDKWTKVDHVIMLPEEIANHLINEPALNVEYIGDKVIEVHLRSNEDFANNISEFIPVWEGQNKIPPQGLSLIHI